MKRNKIILIALLLILIAAWLILKSRRPVERPIPIFAIDSLSIGRIEMQDHQTTISIIHAENGWRINKPVDWEVDLHYFSAFFQDLIRATYTPTVMAEGKMAISNYRTDQANALQVKVFDKKNRLVSHVFFGNIGNAFDYIRFSQSEKIFQIPAKLTTTYNLDLRFWRDPLLLSIEEKEIKKIEVKSARQEYTLVNNKGLWHYYDEIEDFDIKPENRQMMRIVSILLSLETRVFFDGDNSEYLTDFNPPYCDVRIYLHDGSVRRLSFSSLPEKRYLLMLDSEPKTLYEVVGDVLDRFMRYKDIFREQDAYRMGLDL